MERSWADDFFRAVRAKMVKGREEHSDSSLELPAATLIGEMMEECVDIAGWGAIAWMRLVKLQERVKAAEGECARCDCGRMGRAICDNDEQEGR